MACNENGIEFRFKDLNGDTLPKGTCIANVINNAFVLVEYACSYTKEGDDHDELTLEISLDNKNWHSVGAVRPMEENVLVEFSKEQSIFA